MQCDNQEIDELLKAEESRFARIRSSGKYKYASAVVKLFMRILSMQLVPETKGRNLGRGENLENAPKNVLDFHNPFKHKPQNRSLSSFLMDRVFRPLSLTIALYCSLKLFIISAYKSQLDYTIESWRTKSMRSNSSLTHPEKSCKLDHSGSVQDIQDKLKRLAYVLEFLGDPMPSVRGLCFVLYVIYATLIITMFFALLLFLSHRKPRIDYLSFFFDSTRQKRKTRIELTSIVNSIIGSVRRYEYRRDKFARDKQTQFDSIADYHQRRYEFLLHTNRYLMPSKVESVRGRHNQRANSSSLSEQQYLHILVKGRFHDLVQPTILTSHWLQISTTLEFYLMTSLTIFVVVPTAAIFLIMMIKEVSSRIEHRVAQLTCTRQSRALLLETIHLKPLLFAEERDAYNLYEQSPEGVVKFAKLMLIETKYLIGPNQMLQMMEFLFVVVITMTGAVFCYSLYVRFSMYSAFWLNQIEHQLNECARLMEDECRLKFSEIDPVDSSCKSYGVSNAMGKPEATEATQTLMQNQKLAKQTRIVEALTKSYLNFELYRRQQSSCRTFANFLLLQVAILVVQTMVLCYVVGTSLNNDYTTIMLFITTYLVLFFDVLMVAAAHKMSQITRIMKIVATLLAKGVELSMQDAHILVLWRRQTIGEKEAKNAYASSLLGIYLSYDNIITFNGYLVIIWLALLKLVK